MKRFIAILILILSLSAHGQRPANGTYTYKLCYDGSSRCFNTCTVIITGDSVTIISDDDLSVPKGEIIDRGILVQHKSGKWLVARDPDDRNAKKIGECKGGDSIIDFERRRYWSCR